jgi:hypothetical protein
METLPTPPKHEKSQAELRKSLEDRLLGTKETIKSAMDEYEQDGNGEQRNEAMEEKINSLLDKAEQIKTILDSKEELPSYTESISATYTHPDKRTENIEFSLDQKLQEYISFYQKTGLDLPPDFEDKIREIWEQNTNEIQKAIEAEGFNELLLIPGNIPLPELHDKMTKGYNPTYEGDNFKQEGSFAGAKSQNTDKPRIVLTHNTQNLKDRPELASTLNIKGKDVKLDQTLTLEDYLVFQRKYFEETKKHLDEKGWTWLATKSGPRLVDSRWYPSGGELYVNVDGLGYRSGNLGARPSRSFF